MKKILIIGSGISGLTSAIGIAQSGSTAVLVSPYLSERAQSVMAAGGINVSKQTGEDTIESHVEDTLNGGRKIAGKNTVTSLCSDAPEILKWLESLGVVFNRDQNGEIDRRAFGGQRFKRTAFAGASTGKQIVTALIQKAREFEKAGLIERRIGLNFHSALIENGKCYGAIFYSQTDRALETIYADAMIIATGGQNSLFGKTTGSVLCDGYAAGKLFMQGAAMKNLEFIQYHPTTIETPLKRMLITEAARGEGGRLYYLDSDKRVYFMEDKFGERGNLMPRDVVSKCIYDVLPRQVYLDISFLGKKQISERLKEVDELCERYLGLDVSKESIPVAPSVHFFMGGFAVDSRHRTSIEGVYAVGECASIYHGANRLGGNSLLAAVHSARTAVNDILSLPESEKAVPDFTDEISSRTAEFNEYMQTESKFPAVYVLKAMEKIMNEDMGISRDEKRLKEGIESLDYYISICDKIRYDSALSPSQCYSIHAMLVLARAILTSAEARKETRGSHIRNDYPETSDDFAKCSVIHYNSGKFDITYESEDEICW